MNRFLLISIFSLVLLSSQLCMGQSKTIQQLGDSLCVALIENDLGKYQNLLMPKDLFLQALEENVPDGVSEEQKKNVIATMTERYEEEIVEAFLLNYEMEQMKVSGFDIELEGLKFEIVEEDWAKQDPSLQIVHADVKQETFKHLYFYALQYKDVWYVGAPMLQFTQEPKSAQ